jgi:anthranilate/para-aminobenzoate synthase component I
VAASLPNAPSSWGQRPSHALHATTLTHRPRGLQSTREARVVADPVSVPVEMSRAWRAAPVDDLPDVFAGGWCGYTGYDTVRYTCPGKIPFSGAPEDDRGLLDMHLGLYTEAVVFDNATKLAYAVSWAHVDEAGGGDVVEAAWRSALQRVWRPACPWQCERRRPALPPAYALRLCICMLVNGCVQRARARR